MTRRTVLPDSSAAGPGPEPASAQLRAAAALGTLTGGLGLDLPPGADQLRISGITLDSRAVAPGWLYVGLPGARTHGARFAADAASRGAVAMLSDADGAGLASASGLPVLVSDRPRRVMGVLAARIFGEPTRAVPTFGITGTNGKTTTLLLLAAGLRALGLRTGTVGTLGFRLDELVLPLAHTTITTPESPDLQAAFALLVERGAQALAMEVSSHALALDRVSGSHFQVAAFLNLSPEHLDYHHTMEAYFEAKARLFDPALSDVAVVNVDDRYGAELADRVRRAGRPRLVTVGTVPGCGHRLLSWTPTRRGSTVVAELAGRRIDFELGLPGEYNARNAVQALAMLDSAGMDAGLAARGLAGVQVPGRMQHLDLGAGAPAVVIDFAHTPSAVASALEALPGRVIAVLGAGGDRDAEKRLPMGRAAAERARVVVVTDDNPRSEDPAAIRAEVLRGARSADAGAVIIDGGERGPAIERALRIAAPEDTVLILGKGHETTQEVAGVLHHFDDAEQARLAWGRLHPDRTGTSA